MRKTLLIFAIISALICFATAVSTSGVEMKPGEAQAERLFEKGIGKPWVGGNPPWGQGYYGQFYPPSTLPIKKNAANGIHYYLLGTVYDDGYLTLGYGPGALTMPYSPPGYYEVFGCYDNNEKLVGIYIDLAGYDK